MINSQKYQFLDSLVPDDFRNPASFNIIDHIVDDIIKGYLCATDKEEFIKKANDNLFRDGSKAKEKLLELVLLVDR